MELFLLLLGGVVLMIINATAWFYMFDEEEISLGRMGIYIFCVASIFLPYLLFAATLFMLLVCFIDHLDKKYSFERIFSTPIFKRKR